MITVVLAMLSYLLIIIVYQDMLMKCWLNCHLLSSVIIRSSG